VFRNKQSGFSQKLLLVHCIKLGLPFQLIKDSLSFGFEPVLNGFQASDREFIHGFWVYALKCVIPERFLREPPILPFGWEKFMNMRLPYN
jgi:hypothetical protein